MPSGYTDRVWKGKYCGVYEIAAWAQVTKAQVSHWNKEDWFPEPIDEPRMGRIWDYDQVVEALTKKGYPREPGEAGKRMKKAIPVQDEVEGVAVDA